MPLREADGLRYFQFESLIGSQLDHAIFTRQGGVSPTPWRSLNLGSTVGDRLDRVSENLARALTAAGSKAESLFDLWQVHSATVVATDRPGRTNLRADAIITDRSDVTIMMRFADCVPIFVWAPDQVAIGMAHAGWKGTIQEIAKCLVADIQTRYGAKPDSMLAGIGPSIGPDHYPVGPDVSGMVEAALGKEHLHRVGDKTHFDLWAANAVQLREAGVQSIEVAEICTACNIDDWFSHRGERGKTGRFGAFLAIRS